MGGQCVSELERAGWIRRSILQEAACLTFVWSNDIGRVARDFGGVAGMERPLDIDDFCEEAYANQEKFPMIALRQLGDWVLVVEDGGRQGQRPEVLRRIAKHRALSVFWDSSELTRFSSAAFGETRTSFEAVLPEIREGTRPDELETARAGLPWADADPVALMLALAGRLTGLTPAPGWLAGDFRTFPVAPWPDDLAPVPDPLGGLVDYPSTLVTELRTAGECKLRRAGVAAARHVAEVASCLDHPAVRRALEALTGGQKVDDGVLSAVVRKLAWHGTWHRPAGKIRNRLRALEAVRQATHDDPLTALVSVLTRAQQVREVDPGDLARIVTAELRAG